MSWLLPLYIAATVFGLGVTIADMIGALGSRGESEGDAEGTSEGGETDDSEGADASDTADEADGEGQEAEVAVAHGDRASLLAHDRKEPGTPLLRIMALARSAVYFSLGFGPVGVFATAVQGESALISLAWSAPVGLVVMIGARLVRRVLRQELDSQLKGQDFIMEKGTVIVTIGAGQMGKVRVQVGGTNADRFARAKDPAVSIAVGTVVRVVDVADDCIFVEIEEEL